MSKYYDEVTKLPIDKLAQSIVDMTYQYKETVIPKKHYKDILSKEIIEIASNDLNMEICLLKPYINMIKSMKEENRKYFIKALLMVELNIKETSQEIMALARVWEIIEDSKLKTVISNDIIEMYNSIKNSN